MQDKAQSDGRILKSFLPRSHLSAIGKRRGQTPEKNYLAQMQPRKGQKLGLAVQTPGEFFPGGVCEKNSQGRTKKGGRGGWENLDKGVTLARKKGLDIMWQGTAKICKRRKARDERRSFAIKRTTD